MCRGLFPVIQPVVLLLQMLCYAMVCVCLWTTNPISSKTDWYSVLPVALNLTPLENTPPTVQYWNPRKALPAGCSPPTLKSKFTTLLHRTDFLHMNWHGHSFLWPSDRCQTGDFYRMLPSSWPLRGWTQTFYALSLWVWLGRHDLYFTINTKKGIQLHYKCQWVNWSCCTYKLYKTYRCSLQLKKKIPTNEIQHLKLFYASFHPDVHVINNYQFSSLSLPTPGSRGIMSI